MKKKFLLASAMISLLFTGCSTPTSENSVGGASSAPMGMDSSKMAVSVTNDQFDAEFATLIKDYFTAVEEKNFAGYQATVYPPYQEAYGEFLETNGDTLESAFNQMHGSFDEDGYDNWHFTQLDLDYCEKEDIDNFFDMYQKGGIFDEAFEEKCRKDAKEIRDIQFSLYALYEGDEEATPVAREMEIIVLRTQDGKCYLFG